MDEKMISIKHMILQKLAEIENRKNYIESKIEIHEKEIERLEKWQDDNWNKIFEAKTEEEKEKYYKNDDKYEYQIETEKWKIREIKAEAGAYRSDIERIKDMINSIDDINMLGVRY